ncbi:MAG: ParB/RepB/Spo0J family partition protein [Proteobacteria bacterium]|nr:ParB/RepB/Spo0J family partition protein [Pseudomonadota bacterium]MBU1639534.1 ParB/RepB/Spo0J family partition protein [Pseudomonadota bacterium]
MQLKRLTLKEIDFQDETYLLQPIPCQTPPQDLVASIKRVGILHPPLVDEADRGRYRIISGRNRLLAAHKLHFTSCDCRVLPTGSTPLETFSLLLEEKITFTPPTAIEQAIFFKKIGAWLDLDDAARRFLPLLGLEVHPSQAQKLLRLNNLEEVIQEALHDGFLDPKVAWELEKLPFFDRMALFEIMMNLKLSVGNQKKITLISREVAVRNKTTIASFLADAECQEILNSPDLNPPQKTSHFMVWLQKKQFPRFTQAEQEFRDFCRTLHLPPGAAVQHAPFFEKDEITLTLTFKNREELLKNLPHLDLATNNE